ncbi:hypothetical protein Lepto782_11035 [Leptospira interrogans serovar Canicola]|uniref:Uncharacterized protein n=1 Tax=Leptospira interrogans serovar Canicola TaxID=211880 RepID=A0AAP9WAZ5_LEPIR|nr:hypothetical protein [Leptospira interrogans]QOI42747.1 hypothetical protein Lepto782_11035 [Leptospira interrogans serovar Canicola]
MPQFAESANARKAVEKPLNVGTPMKIKFVNRVYAAIREVLRKGWRTLGPFSTASGAVEIYERFFSLTEKHTFCK